MWAGMWGSLAIFRSQKGSAGKQVWETLFYTKIIIVLPECHTKQANALYGQNAEFLIWNRVVYKVTTGLQMVNSTTHQVRPLSMDKEVQFHCYNGHLKARMLVVRAHDILQMYFTGKTSGWVFQHITATKHTIQGKSCFGIWNWYRLQMTMPKRSSNALRTLPWGQGFRKPLPRVSSQQAVARWNVGHAAGD